MPDSREVWASSACDYVKNAIKAIESLFEEDGKGYVLKKQSEESISYELQAQGGCFG
jgi:hypothetical protein